MGGPSCAGAVFSAKPRHVKRGTGGTGDDSSDEPLPRSRRGTLERAGSVDGGVGADREIGRGEGGAVGAVVGGWGCIGVCCHREVRGRVWWSGVGGDAGRCSTDPTRKRPPLDGPPCIRPWSGRRDSNPRPSAWEAGSPGLNSCAREVASQRPYPSSRLHSVR